MATAIWDTARGRQTLILRRIPLDRLSLVLSSLHHICIANVSINTTLNVIIKQVAYGLPSANAYATGHPHNVGVITGVDYGYGRVSGYGAIGNRGYASYGGHAGYGSARGFGGYRGSYYG